MKKDWFEQGDVCIVPTSKIPDGFKPTGAALLQEGEHTGHAHRLYGSDFSVYTDDGKFTNEKKKYLRLVTPTMLKHEEHREINLPAGDYEIRIVREFDHFENEARQVAD